MSCETRELCLCSSDSPRREVLIVGRVGKQLYNQLVVASRSPGFASASAQIDCSADVISGPFMGIILGH